MLKGIAGDRTVLADDCYGVGVPHDECLDDDDVIHLPVVGMQALEAVFAGWWTFWSDPEEANEEPLKWDTRGHVLGGLTVEHLDFTAARYAEHSGLRWDHFHPKAILSLPVGYERRLLDIMHAWERHPEKLVSWLTLIHWRPKPDGDVRPIGATFLIRRLW